MNIIIPMGGIGHRFACEGYRFPKPLVKIVGRPMLFWLIDHLNTQEDDMIYIGMSEAIEQQFGLMQMLHIEYPKKVFREVSLGFPTRGAAETLFIILQSIDEDRLKRKTISLDCDTIYFKTILDDFRLLPTHMNASFFFEDHGEKPIYSYLLFANNTVNTNSEETTLKTTTSSSHPIVIDVREKIMISSHANTGAYAFASASVLKKYCALVLDQPVGLAGEYYTTSVIKMMLNHQEVFVGIHVPIDDFVCVGTPKQLELFLKNLKIKSNRQQLEQLSITKNVKINKFRQMRFCFDLDNTLVSYPSIHGDYTSVKPKIDNIQLVRELYNAGHYIIIQTARRMKTHRGNVGTVIADIGYITLETLKKFDIPYHELLFGKPYADIYVDDLAVHALIDTAKEIGWHLDDDRETETSNNLDPESKTNEKNTKDFVRPRHFNTIQSLGKLIIKSGPKENLDGEIFFYKHIPPPIKDLFVQLESIVTNDETHLQMTMIPRSSIVLERIDGITYSHLLTNFCLTSGRLLKVLSSLKRLHDIEHLPDDQLDDDKLVNIYANYSTKVQSRFKEYRDIYETIEGLSIGDNKITSEMLMNEIVLYLNNYAVDARGKPSRIIHGDPVFTNILLTSDNQIKFLDMRGSLGHHLTMRGDINYDLSKIYQSLTGYDFILHDKYNDVMTDTDRFLIYENYMKEFHQIFADFIENQYGIISLKDIQMITIQFYFTLIPLHNNRQHQIQFLNLAKKLYRDWQNS